MDGSESGYIEDIKAMVINELNSKILSCKESEYDTDKIGLFVINLKRRPERLLRISKSLNDLGIKNFEIIEALDGSCISESEIENLVDLKARESVFGQLHMNSGEIGCSASHLMAYNKIINESYSCAVILEDDADLGEDFINFWKQLSLNKKNEMPDVVLLGYRSSSELSLLATEHSIGRQSLCEFELSSRKVGKVWGTHAYLISNIGAAKMISANEKIRFIADEVWNVFLSSISLYVVNPPIAWAGQAGSDISEDNQDRAKIWDCSI
jgi:glycosyl transferase family 25